jgi:predicted small integral membrane protein
VLLILAVPVDDDGHPRMDRPADPRLLDGLDLPGRPVLLVHRSLLIIMTLLAIRFPETPRVGILRIETTRGDRLFITLLGTAFIHLGWLFFAGPDALWGALILSLAYAFAVFRWV